MKIVLIGAGNVGYHLGKALHRAGEEIVQVYSRQVQKARALANLTESEYTTDLKQIRRDGDLYLLAVKDDAIRTVAVQLSGQVGHNLIVHTSGSVPGATFRDCGFSRYGIFYPLQTFTIGKEPDFSKIPFIVQANRPDDLEQLKQLAAGLGADSYCLTDEQKAILHVAAVFTNNFTNYLYQVARTILEREKIPFSLLLPLAEETVDKLKMGSPAEMQTGPARRGDQETIRRHLALLDQDPLFREIYRQLSDAIRETYASGDELTD